MRCNCSGYSMRGAVAVTARLADLDITAGKEWLTLYQRRSDPDQYGVNAACPDGVSPFDFPEVPVNEGRNHPCDRPTDGGPDIAGYLRHVPVTTP